MLLANETVAKEYCRKEIPFLYRTHENPDMDKMEGVLSFYQKSGDFCEQEYGRDHTEGSAGNPVRN